MGVFNSIYCLSLPHHTRHAGHWKIGGFLREREINPLLQRAGDTRRPDRWMCKSAELNECWLVEKRVSGASSSASRSLGICNKRGFRQHGRRSVSFQGVGQKALRHISLRLHVSRSALSLSSIMYFYGWRMAFCFHPQLIAMINVAVLLFMLATCQTVSAS